MVLDELMSEDNDEALLDRANSPCAHDMARKKESLDCLFWRCWACDGRNMFAARRAACKHCGLRKGSESAEYWWRSYSAAGGSIDVVGWEDSRRMEGEVSGDEGDANEDYDEAKKGFNDKWNFGVDRVIMVVMLTIIFICQMKMIVSAD